MFCCERVTLIYLMPIMLKVGFFCTLYNLLNNRFTPKTRILKFHGTQKNRHGQLFSKTSSTGINQRPESSQCKLKRGFNFDLVPIQTILRNFDDLIKLVFTCPKNISLIVTHWLPVHCCITTTQCTCCIALNFIFSMPRRIQSFSLSRGRWLSYRAHQETESLCRDPSLDLLQSGRSHCL